MRVLLVEDEPRLAEPLLALLRSESYEAHWAGDLESAYGLLHEGEPDLAVLDVMLPDGEDAGFAFARDIRNAGFRGGILFLTARDTLEDRINGLDLGGDDYLVKPFHLLEFSARVRALLRRDALTKCERFERGGLRVELGLRWVSWQGESIDLTDKEFRILELLALYPEKTFTVDELLARVFPQAESGTRIVRVYVHHLRQKLAANVVRTVPGGYRLGV